MLEAIYAMPVYAFTQTLLGTAIPDICPPQIQILAKFFSTQKRVNCDKIVFATKHYNGNKTDFAAKQHKF